MGKASEEFHAIVVEKMMQDFATMLKMRREKRIIAWRCFICGKFTFHERTSGGGWKCIYSYKHRKDNDDIS